MVSSEWTTGASGVSPSGAEFAAALTEVCGSLARQLIADAEGASHDIAVIVRNASTESAAVAVARAVTVCHSPAIRLPDVIRPATSTARGEYFINCIFLIPF